MCAFTGCSKLVEASAIGFSLVVTFASVGCVRRKAARASLMYKNSLRCVCESNSTVVGNKSVVVVTHPIQLTCVCE